MDNTIVLLGGTSDLARKKIFPALYELYRKSDLNITIIGTSRKDLDDESFRKMSLKEIDGDKSEEFKKRVTFQRMAFSDDGNYLELKKKIEKIKGNKIFYLSTLPEHFSIITAKLAEHDLVGKNDKILYEKPFGNDLKTSHELNKIINDRFDENQIYRIDHYLNKEMVQNIPVLRFANSMIEPVWDSANIDHIQIIISEDFGIEGRGEFYDKQGAIKDVFQNHILQLLSLAAMEPPKEYDAKCIRDEKVTILKSIDIKECITGQYEGYRNAEGVSGDSVTETFTAMKIRIKNKRWEGIPVYAITGKNLEKNAVHVYIEFKNTQCMLFEDMCDTQPNNLVISLKPEEEIYFTINTKMPGKAGTTTSKMEFCYSCQHGKDTPEAYENLIKEAIEGVQNSFVRYDEIEEQWRVTESIRAPKKPFIYKKGTFPQEAVDFIRKDGKDWFI